MKNMRANEWIEMLMEKSELNIVIDDPHTNLKYRDGSYSMRSDVIEYTRRFSKPVIFHELAHWTGHEKRLNRAAMLNPFAMWGINTHNDMEESIAWLMSKSMCKIFGGDAYYYTKWKKINRGYININNPIAINQAKAAHHYICDELKLI